MWLVRCLYMNEHRLTPSGKPYDIHERLLDFACEIVGAAQFLHTRGPIGRELSYQLLSAGTSTGANAEESDGASSHDDFIAIETIEHSALGIEHWALIHSCSTSQSATIFGLAFRSSAASASSTAA